MRDVVQLVEDFFTAPVELTGCPATVSIRDVWWEKRGDTLYPWRVSERKGEVTYGYPCGEPITKAQWEQLAKRQE